MTEPPVAAPWSALFQRLASERLFLALLSIALLLPLGLSRSPADRPMLGLPLATSGDEPHYLAMLHSLVSDGDLDLRNNYLAARRGSIDLGAGRAGAPLDHQISWYGADGSWHQWDQTYEYAPDPSQPSGKALSPSLKPGQSSEFEGRPEYSHHPPGLAFLLAPLLYPFRGTLWVEHLALVITTLGTFGMGLFLRQLFRALSKDAGIANAATLLAILGSPSWNYARTVFSEPWLALFAAGALALVITRDAYFLAGCLLALGIQMKPPFALLAVPIACERLLARDLKRAVTFSFPIAVSTAAVLLENQHFFGSPLRTAQPWASGNLLIGLAGVLFSPAHGLFLYAPALLIAAFGWPTLLRTQPRLGWLALTMSLPYLLLMSLWAVWDGGYCYGPRLISPIIPLLFLGIAPVLGGLRQRSRGFLRFAASTCAVSVLISALGALVHVAFWAKHPLITPVELLLQKL